MATFEGFFAVLTAFKVLICNNVANCLYFISTVCLHGFYNKGLLKSLNIYFMQCVAINVSTSKNNALYCIIGLRLRKI